MPPANLSPKDLICPPMSLGSYICDVHRGKPLLLENLVHGYSQKSELLKDLLCVLGVVGGLEPLSASRPGATDLVTVFDKTVEVPVATLAADGVTIIPSEKKLIQICAGQKALVVDRLRALPANLTATQSGNIVFKRMAVMGFSEGFCPPGEPADGDDLGTFQNIEHVILPPEGGFDVHARNFDLFSKALFTIHARMWSTC